MLGIVSIPVVHDMTGEWEGGIVEKFDDVVVDESLEVILPRFDFKDRNILSNLDLLIKLSEGNA